jgi:pyruvate kinase
MAQKIELPMSENCDIREFMAHSAIEATERLGVKGIITDSNTGSTARSLAAFRGPTPVLAICYNDKLQRLLNLSYGVIPVYQKEHIGSEKLFLAAVRMLRQKGYVNLDDKIAYMSGNIGAGGGTKFLEINTVREVFDQSFQFHLPNV